MICPMCHRENPSSAAFCIMCGHPLADLNRKGEEADSARNVFPDDARVQPVEAGSASGSAPKPPAPVQEPTDGEQGTRTTPQGAPVAPGASDSSSATGAATQTHDGTDGLAVASLVCSIVGIFFLQIILPILGIVFGAVARGRNPKDSTNGKLALAGLIVGIIVLVLSILAVIAIVMLGFAVGTEAYGLASL